MPCDSCRREAGGLGGLGGGKVLRFRRIRAEVVKLRRGSVVGAEPFPAAVAHGEIRQRFLPGKFGAAWGAAEEERLVARGTGVTKQRPVHGDAIKGGARRR